MRRLAALEAGPRLAAIAILAAMSGWVATASLQQDFAAYYTAGAAVARGLSPYVNHLPTADGPWDGVAVYRHSRFLYPPLAAELFRPWAALPFAWAKAMFTAASAAAAVAAFAITVTFASDGAAAESVVHRRRAGWLALASAVWPPTLLALERGQMDLLLLPALVAAWRWRARPAVAGTLLASAAMFKPMLLGVVPLLLCGRRFRWAAMTVGVLLLLAMINLAAAGRGRCAEYLWQVLPRAASYGEGGPENMLLSEGEIARAGDDLAEGVARVDGRGRAYPQQIGDFRRNASLPRLLAGDGKPPMEAAVLVLVLCLAPLAVGARRSPDSALWYCGGLVATVVAAPVSWAMGLVWALPLGWLALADRKIDPGINPPSSAALPLGFGFAAGFAGPLLPGAWVLVGLTAVAAAAVATVARRSATTTTTTTPARPAP